MLLLQHVHFRNKDNVYITFTVSLPELKVAVIYSALVAVCKLDIKSGLCEILTVKTKCFVSSES